MNGGNEGLRGRHSLVRPTSCYTCNNELPSMNNHVDEESKSQWPEVFGFFVMLNRRRIQY